MNVVLDAVTADTVCSDLDPSAVYAGSVSRVLAYELSWMGCWRLDICVGSDRYPLSTTFLAQFDRPSEFFSREELKFFRYIGAL